MEEYITVKDIYGNDFYARGDVEGKYISVLECGYVILKDGTFIILSSNHGESLTDFYVNYHKVLLSESMTTQDAIMTLAHDGFVVYLGTNRNNISEGNDFGFSVLYLVENMTQEQKESCNKLLATNRKILNPNENKLDIEYGNGINLQPFSEDKVTELLFVNNKVL